MSSSSYPNLLEKKHSLTAPSSTKHSLKLPHQPDQSNSNQRILDVMTRLKESSLGLRDSNFSVNSGIQSEFLQACAQGDLNAVELALISGAKINSRDEWGRNGLMYAAAEGHVVVGEYLIGKGIDLKAKNMFEETAYTVALITHNEEFCKMLELHEEFESDSELFSRRESRAEDIPYNLKEEISVDEANSLDVSMLNMMSTEHSKGHNLTIEVLEGTHLFSLLPPKRLSNLAHVRIDVGEHQFKTSCIELKDREFLEVLQWSEIFSCKIDIKKKPPIKVTLCDEEEFELGEFRVGFGWYGASSGGVLEWFDLQEPTKSTIKKMGFINTPSETSLLTLNESSPPKPKPKIRIQIILQKNKETALIERPEIQIDSPQEMLTVLATYQSLHSDPVARDVAETVVSCFKSLLKQDILLTNVQHNVERFLKQNNHKIATDILKSAFLKFQFPQEKQKEIINKILSYAVPSKNKLSDIMKKFTSEVLSSWQLDPTNISEFVNRAFSRNYEEGFLNTIGLSGPGKYVLPIWPKLVVSVTTTTYLILVDTYTRFVDAYFSSKSTHFTKMANPDYYGRFASCVFEALVRYKLGMVSTQTGKGFLEFLFSFDSDIQLTLQKKLGKLDQKFIAEWKKSIRPYCAEKYITTRNFLLANVSDISFLTESLTGKKTQNRLLDSSMTNQLMKKQEESISNSAILKVRSLSTSDSKSEMMASLEMLPPSPSQLGKSPDVKLRALLPTSSNRALLMSNLAEGITDKSKIVPALFLLEPEINKAISLFNSFVKQKYVRIVNNSLSNITDDKYDALIVAGDPFAYDGNSFPLKEIVSVCGEETLSQLRRKIREDYFGEMASGASIFMDLPPNCQCRYLIYTATTPNSNHNVFSCFWSSLQEVLRINQRTTQKKSKTAPIRSVVCIPQDYFLSTFSRGESSRQLHEAYQQFVDTIQKPEQIIPLETRLKQRAPIKETAEEKLTRHKEHFHFLIREGLLKERKFIDEFGIDYLINLMIDSLGKESTPTKERKSLSGSIGSREKSTPKPKPNMATLFKDLRSGQGKAYELQKEAASALLYYTFPVEFIPKTRKKLENCSLLDALIEFAASGKVPGFNQLDRKEIELGEPIAEGISGKVFKGKFRDHSVAIKHCSPHYQGYDSVDVTREITVMSLLHHKNILHCFGAATVGTDSFIVSELIEGPTLHQWVRSFPNGIELVAGLNVAVQIARGLCYIHDLHLLHCDLKGKNILIQRAQHSEDILAKIIDFGSSRTLYYEPELEIPVGTPQWTAPEVSQRKGYTLKSDIFSLGMVYYEILTAQQPFHDVERTLEVTSLIEKGRRPAISKQHSSWCPTFPKIIEKCWHQKPEKRPTSKEVIDMLGEIADEVHFSFK